VHPSFIVDGLRGRCCCAGEVFVFHPWSRRRGLLNCGSSLCCDACSVVMFFPPEPPLRLLHPFLSPHPPHFIAPPPTPYPPVVLFLLYSKPTRTHSIFFLLPSSDPPCICTADELYQYLISPDAQVTWDMGSTQQSTKTLRNNLSRR